MDAHSHTDIHTHTTHKYARASPQVYTEVTNASGREERLLYFCIYQFETIDFSKHYSSQFTALLAAQIV